MTACRRRTTSSKTWNHPPRRSTSSRVSDVGAGRRSPPIERKKERELHKQGRFVAAAQVPLRRSDAPPPRLHLPSLTLFSLRVSLHIHPISGGWCAFRAGVVNASIGQASGSREHLKTAQQYFQVIALLKSTRCNAHHRARGT